MKKLLVIAVFISGCATTQEVYLTPVSYDQVVKICLNPGKGLSQRYFVGRGHACRYGNRIFYEKRHEQSLLKAHKLLNEACPAIPASRSILDEICGTDANGCYFPKLHQAAYLEGNASAYLHECKHMRGWTHE